MKVIAEGIWCRNCEYLEDPEDTHNRESCIACGCATELHIPVKVVEA